MHIHARLLIGNNVIAQNMSAASSALREPYIAVARDRIIGYVQSERTKITDGNPIVAVVYNKAFFNGNRSACARPDINAYNINRLRSYFN